VIKALPRFVDGGSTDGQRDHDPLASRVGDFASKALAQRGSDDKYGTALGDTYSRDRS
jgi:hypothetical protein